MQRRTKLYWFAVRRCHAGYGLYYLRIQPLYCRYVLLFLCWLPRAVQGNCLLHSCHCRKQCWWYDCSAAEKVIESAALKTLSFLQTQKAYPLQKRIRFFHAKYSNFLLLLRIFILAIFCGNAEKNKTLLVRCSWSSCRLWSLSSADSTTVLQICFIISLLVVQSRLRQLFTSFLPLPETVSAV